MKCLVCKSEKMCGCKWIGVIVIILVVIIGGYFLLRGGYQAPASPPKGYQAPTPSPESPSAGQVTPPGAQVREITVSGTEFSFNPSSIIVSSGERVKINFRNEGAAPHNFTIAESGKLVSTETIGGGQTDTIEFTAPSSGTLTFFCSVAGHRQRGMEGNLNVQ